MTGYTFGCYAVESSHGEVVEAGQELAGLADMRDKLASRVGNWRLCTSSRATLPRLPPLTLWPRRG